MTSGLTLIAWARAAGEATPTPTPKTNIGAMASSTLRCPESTAPRKANDASTLKRLAQTARRSIGSSGMRRVAATLPIQTPASTMAG